MRFLLTVLLFLSLISCDTEKQKSIAESTDTLRIERVSDINSEKHTPTISLEEETETENNIQESKVDCETFWKNRVLTPSIKDNYLGEILSNSTLTKNNKEFLETLRYEKFNNLAFENVLSPIFRLSNTELGIFSFYNSKESSLVSKYNTSNNLEYFDTIRHHPKFLDSILKSKSKPIINYYTLNKKASTSILVLEEYIGECLEYYKYSIDTKNITLSDKILFASPFNIDLIYENTPKIDSLIKNNFIKECLDCPNSMNLQKTFARIEGTENLYFVYADTFPINNKLDTPSRALIYINSNKEIIYLWYEEFDLFGCSCL